MSVSFRQLPPTLEQTGSISISVLKDRHPQSTAYIVGKGPSLASLTAEDFGPGPIITLNEAILVVQGLTLFNPIYAMQKDGCVTGSELIPRPCGTCEPFGWQRFPVVNPRPDVTTIFSQALSSWCLHGRANRYVFDDAELGYSDQPLTMSILEAIPFAKHLGAVALVVLCCDSLVTGDTGYTELETAAPAALAVAQENLMGVRSSVLAALESFGPHRLVIPGVS